MKLVCPRGFMAFSDGHSGPKEGLPDGDKLAADKARELNIPIVKTGDTFEPILYGWKSFRNAPCVQETIRQALRQPVYVLLGNHEGRIEWLRELFRDTNVHVYKTLDIDVNGKKFHLEHGDRFAFDWNHLGWLFKGVAFFMLHVAPKLWLRLTRKWQPGAMKPPYGTESGSYTFTVMRIWENAFQDAMKHKRVNIMGHTHSALSMGGDRAWIFDTGDARDGSAVYVDAQGNGSIKFFGGTSGHNT